MHDDRLTLQLRTSAVLADRVNSLRVAMHYHHQFTRWCCRKKTTVVELQSQDCGGLKLQPPGLHLYNTARYTKTMNINVTLYLLDV